MGSNEFTLYFRISSIFDLFYLYSWKNQATATSATALRRIYHSSWKSLILSILRGAGLVSRLSEWLVRWHEIIGDCDPIHYFFHLFHVIAGCGHVEWNCVARTPPGLDYLDLTRSRSWVSRSLLFSNKRIRGCLRCFMRLLGLFRQWIPRIAFIDLLRGSIRICDVGRWSNRQLNQVWLLVRGRGCYLVRIHLLLIHEENICGDIGIVRLFCQKTWRLCLDTIVWLLWLLWLQLE